MKLYLSSYRVPVAEKLFALLGTQPEQVKMALIPNAKDYYAERARQFKINDVQTYMENIGLKPEVVDLRDCTPENIKERLAGYDLIWAMGGNTFILRDEMRRSGFENIIGELLESGVVYGGDSAGALVVGPSLKGVEHADEPLFAEHQIYEGLGVIPYVVVPHADNTDFGDAIDKLIAEHKADPNTVILNDNQAWVVDGDKTEMITGSIN